jgi:hypothetical protein
MTEPLVEETHITLPVYRRHVTDGGLSQFALVGFAVAVVTVGVGTAAGLALVPVVGSFLGMFLGGFVAGLAIEERPLLEAGVAAVLASLGILAAGAVIGNGVLAAVSALGSIAPATLLVSVLLSFTVGAFGAHFGDDLRDGLTDPVETSPARSTEPAVLEPRSEKDRAREVEDEPEPLESDAQKERDRVDDGATDESLDRIDSDDVELERE